jgi:antitoxin component YwqK of YwqJK toxin-antitoxin module
MNCLASKATHTYLSFLDHASSFHLLIRLHYEDLMNLCKIRPYLWKLVYTPWFQEKWKEYNITTVENETKSDLREIDRLGRKHGRVVVVYERDLSGKEQIYSNNVLQWSQLKDNYGSTTVTYTYLDRDVYKREIVEHCDGERSYICYKNNLRHGLTRFCDTASGWTWVSFVNGKQHGLAVRWFPNGTRQYMGRMENDRWLGTHYRWLINGILEKKTEFTIHDRDDPLSRRMC